MLLRQVNAARPFEARKGEVTKAWMAVAQTLADHAEFKRPSFDYKKAQHRFSVLMDGHVSCDDASAKASGVSEDHDEKIQLLDELLAAYMDSKMQERQKREDVLAKVERGELEGERIRDMALQAMGKRKAKVEDEDDDTDKNTSSGGRLAKLTTSMQEASKAERDLREKELEFRKHQFEQEILERQKDRELALEQARMQHEATLALIAAAKKKPIITTQLIQLWC